MTLGVLASGHLGHKVLRQLVVDKTVRFVMTDRNSTDIQFFCENQKIPCFIGNPRRGNCSNFLKDKTIDVLVSVNYLFIIEKDLIDLPSKLTFNVHGSLLPKYRGRTPHVWAIINNETATGVTAHIIDEDCDTGDIIQQIQVPIEDSDTGATVLNKFERLYPKLIANVLKRVEDNQIICLPQKAELATFFGKRTPDDGLIDWNWQRERIRNWVRAQAYPYPGAFTWDGSSKLIIDEVIFDEYGFDYRTPNGQVLTPNPLRVKVPNGVLRVTNIRDPNTSCKEGTILK